jgi:PBP1b-binding outer membrane lipoprotein LpoB
MKVIKQISVFGLAVILLSSCAKIFYSPDAYSLAQNQKIFAILPPTVSIAANKKVDAEAMIEQQKN